MNNIGEVRKYRDDQIHKLIEEHKGIIKLTWELIEQDVLSEEIKGDKRKNTSESTFWNKLGDRRKGLDEVEKSLDKIEKLEKSLSDYEEGQAATEGGEDQQTNGKRVHPSKVHSRT